MHMNVKNCLLKIISCLFLALTGCTLDVLVNDLAADSDGDFLRRGDKISLDQSFQSDLTTIYASTDDVNYTLAVDNIPGEVHFLSVEKDSNVNEDYTFYVLNKSNAAPVDLADKSVWSLNPYTKVVEKFFELPSSVEYCLDVYEKKDAIHLYCIDSFYEPMSFVFNKSTKILGSLADHLGYVSNSTDVYYVSLISNSDVLSEREIVALFKRVDAANPGEGILQKIYYYVGTEFREVHIDPVDLANIDYGLSLGVSNQQHLLESKKIVLSGYINGTGERPVFSLDFSNLNNLTMTYFMPLDLEFFGQINGKPLLYKYENLEFKIYAYNQANKTMEQLSLISYVAGFTPLSLVSYVSVFTPFTLNNFLYILDNDGSIKKCTLAGSCTVFFANFVGQGYQQFSSSGSSRYYRSGSNILEINLNTESYSLRSDLVDLLAMASITPDDISSITEYDDYLIISGAFTPSNLVITKTTPATKIDGYGYYCSVPSNELENVLKQKHRYEGKKTKKINLMLRNMACA